MLLMMDSGPEYFIYWATHSQAVCREISLNSYFVFVVCCAFEFFSLQHHSCVPGAILILVLGHIKCQNSFALRTHTHTHSANVCSTFYAEIHEFLGAFCCNIIHLSFNCVNQWVIDSTHGGPLLHQRQKFAPNGYHGTERCQPVVLSAKLSTERAPSHCLP